MQLVPRATPRVFWLRARCTAPARMSRIQVSTRRSTGSQPFILAPSLLRLAADHERTVLRALRHRCSLLDKLEAWLRLGLLAPRVPLSMRAHAREALFGELHIITGGLGWQKLRKHTIRLFIHFQEQKPDAAPPGATQRHLCTTQKVNSLFIPQPIDRPQTLGHSSSPSSSGISHQTHHHPQAITVL
jgi:hypothetical protein